MHNRRWFRETTLPPTEGRITQAYFIRRKIEEELRITINRSIRTDPTGAIATLMTSWDTAAPIPVGLTPILQLMTVGIQKPADISARIGYMNRFGIGAVPISLYVQGDVRNHGRCRVFIEEGEPCIGMPEFWLWREYAGHRAAYRTYVHRLASLLHMPELMHGLSAEREFADIYPPARQRRRRIDVLTWPELQREYTAIDWSAMMSAWGLSDEQMRTMTYNVVSRPFLHHIQSRLRSWSLDRWRGWFALLVAQWIAGLAPPGPLRAAWFAYNRRHLQGVEVDEKPDSLRMSIIQALLPNTLGRLWVRDHCDPAMKRTVGAMAENIRAAAIAAMGKTSWMAASTRVAAVKKLRGLTIEICWPPMDDWPTAEPACALTPDSYVQNLQGLSAAATDFNINQRDCRRPTGNGWSRPVFEVNAYYYPDENRFLLPAAILRPPFYDSKRSIAWNYGGIGATVGHELCHAFDADGRNYDHRGDKRQWWTRGDAKEYRARASRVVHLYQTRKYRGMKVDGSLTLIENIADLGGLEFALAGARRALGRALTKEELREFFESYAVSWRAKDRRARAADLLVRDPHAPPLLRVNHTVRQLDEWYEAYDVDPSCPDYIAPAQRIHFFA